MKISSKRSKANGYLQAVKQKENCGDLGLPALGGTLLSCCGRLHTEQRLPAPVEDSGYSSLLFIGKDGTGGAKVKGP